MQHRLQGERWTLMNKYEDNLDLCCSLSLPIPHMVPLKRRLKKKIFSDFQKKPLGHCVCCVPTCVHTCLCVCASDCLSLCSTIWMCALLCVHACGRYCVGVRCSFLTEPPVSCICESFVLFSISYSALQKSHLAGLLKSCCPWREEK